MRIGNARITGLACVAAGLVTAIAVRAKRIQRAYTFSGKSVVVTGGSRGLGLVLARQLAAEGARITLIARDENELQRASDDIRDRHRSADVLIVRADVGKREDVERAISQALKHYGAIDVLINNAGIIQVGPLDHMKLSDYDDAMKPHFWGLCSWSWCAIASSLPLITISAERAARQILDACRRGDAELVITVQAKLAILARTIAPELFSDAMALVQRALPRPVGPEGDIAEPGRSAGSNWVASTVLAPMYAAARRNNEL